MYSYDRTAKAVQPAYGRDHFLVRVANELSIVRLDQSKGKPIGCLVAFARFSASSDCDAFSVELAKAEKGYGPTVYDAVMEVVHPKGLTAAVGSSTSSKAEKVWDVYFRRGDIKKEPKPEDSRCKIKGRESLDHIYYKKPGKAAAAVMTADEYNKHPKVVEHFGEPQQLKRPQSDLWDCTQNIQN